jgi:competence protein ComEC
LISGSAFATVRSAIMITIMFVAVILDRPALALRNVALSALVILILFPESLLDAGFQMSFAAVVGLVSAYEWLAQRRVQRVGQRGVERGVVARGVAFITEIFLSTIIASLAVAPFAIYHFHNTQQLALIGNAIAIPICNLIVMPAALATLVAMPFGFEAGPLFVMGYGIDVMSAIARWVAGLPGAVMKVPSIPTMSFVLVVVGGLWLTLWSRAWRLLGLAPIAAGLVLAPGQPRPDVLVGRDGTTVAVRDRSGQLSALMSRGSSFELARWLEADGDRRTAKEAAGATAFRCDSIGCISDSGGHRIVISANAAAQRDDCGTAGVVILKYQRTKHCDGAKASVVIDPAALAGDGVHAIYLTGAATRVETVRAQRGDRPWSRRIERQRPPSTVAAQERVAGFAGLERRFRDPPRAEIEDESWPRAKPELE